MIAPRCLIAGALISGLSCGMASRSPENGFVCTALSFRAGPWDQQRFGRRRGNAGSLQLPNLTALAVDLNAHTLDLGPNVSDIRHGKPCENEWRKNKQ